MTEYILDGDAIFNVNGELIYDGVDRLNGERIIRHMQAADYYEAQYNAAKQKLDVLRAERKRGDTYRARARALRRQAKAWRATSEYNNEQASYFQDVSIYLRELLNGEVKP